MQPAIDGARKSAGINEADPLRLESSAKLSHVLLAHADAGCFGKVRKAPTKGGARHAGLCRRHVDTVSLNARLTQSD